MDVRVIGFATVSDVLGSQPVALVLADGSRVSDLKAALVERHPELATIWPRLAVAVDGELTAADPVLADDCEVALLPPVSGGAGDEGGARVELVDTPIDVAAVERSVADPACGAVVLFLGTVRNHHQGRGVERLTYSAYRPMALAKLRQIAGELEAGGGCRVALVHRLGEITVGEPSVVIAVASAHRRAAYEASREALERLKREVPIWKREHYAGGEAAWREEERLVGAEP